MTFLQRKNSKNKPKTPSLRSGARWLLGRFRILSRSVMLERRRSRSRAVSGPGSASGSASGSVSTFGDVFIMRSDGFSEKNSARVVPFSSLPAISLTARRCYTWRRSSSRNYTSQTNYTVYWEFSPTPQVLLGNSSVCEKNKTIHQHHQKQTSSSSRNLCDDCTTMCTLNFRVKGWAINVRRR